jgi:hypothetical protein
MNLADNFRPYSKSTQCAVTPPTPLRDKGRDGYAEATARATKNHRIYCEDCGKPIPKGKEERHHIRKRSALGGNEATNILVLCKADHDYREAHGGRKKPSK